MIRILISDKLSIEAIDFLKKNPNFQVDTGQEYLNQIENYDALLVRSQTQVTAQLLEKATRLKLVGRAGIGLDNIDLKAAAEKKIQVINTPQGNLVTTAEHTIALLMALARHIPQANASLKKGKWEKSKFLGTELRDKTLGVMGLGNVGKIVAELGAGLKMQVIAYDPLTQSDLSVSLDQLYKNSDFISIHVPLMPQTRYLLSTEAFSKMKPGVRIIHAARGGILDENALLEALNSGKVAGAALDVFEQEPPPEDHPLIRHPNVIVTPHLAASTREAQDRVGLQLAEKTNLFFVSVK
ncbi:MAG: hydroxyacid dehydrogenase [Myxococcaceae bacterium]